MENINNENKTNTLLKDLIKIIFLVITLIILKIK